MKKDLVNDVNIQIFITFINAHSCCFMDTFYIQYIGIKVFVFWVRKTKIMLVKFITKHKHKQHFQKQLKIPYEQRKKREWKRIIQERYCLYYFIIKNVRRVIQLRLSTALILSLIKNIC